MSDPPEPEIEIAVEQPGWAAALSDPSAVCRTAATLALGEAPTLGAVSILLADDARLQGLNREYRGVDRPTNVLSFPADAPDVPGELRFWGDIAVALETTSREAAERDLRVADHLTHLVIHGALHLFGHDHIDDAEAEAMEALERRLLARLGIADPYAGAPAIEAAQ